MDAVQDEYYRSLLNSPVVVRKKSDGFVKTGILTNFTEKKLYIKYKDGRIAELDREDLSSVEPDPKKGPF